MGCNETTKVLPLTAQRAIKAKQEAKSFILSIAQFDENYDWYCTTCRNLEHSALKSLSLSFDSKLVLKRNPSVSYS